MSKQDNLFEAIRTHDAALLKLQLDDDSTLVSARDEAGLSPILHACYQKRADMIKLLLDAGASLDLFEAAAVGSADRVNELLADAPDQIGSWSADGFTPLHLACYFGREQAVKTLLTQGADAGVASRNAMTLMPLHAAAASGDNAIVKLLIESGVDVNTRQAGGFTALHAAAGRGDMELVSMLLGAGAEPAVAADDERTPWTLASGKGHHDVAEILKPNGA